MFCKDTEILTFEGWKKCTDLVSGDQVPTLQLGATAGSPGKITKKTIKSIERSYYTGKMIHFDGRSVNILVTPEHQLLSKEVHEDSLYSIRARDVSFAQYNFCSFGSWTKKEKNNNKYKYWLQFLGFWYGDGYKSKRDKTHREWLVGFNLSKQRKIDYILKIIKKLRLPHRTYQEKGKGGRLRIFVKNKKLYQTLKGKSHTKKIPSFLYSSSSENIMWFLRGFIEADGHVSKNGDISLYSCNKKMIDDLQSLLLFAGRSGRMTSRPPRVAFMGSRVIQGSTQHTLHVHKDGKLLQLKKKNRKIVDYSGEAVSILDPDIDYVYVRREGCVLWAGAK